VEESAFARVRMRAARSVSDTGSDDGTSRGRRAVEEKYPFSLSISSRPGSLPADRNLLLTSPVSCSLSAGG
jgi:hypothetical protein